MFDLAGAELNRRFSPYCWRTKLSLKHKGLDFDTIPWRLTEKSAIAPYNSQRVSVIVDDGRSVADSWTTRSISKTPTQIDRRCSAASKNGRSHGSTINGPM
jgi:hypothetical protein